jgi:hypothetical protein
MRPGKRIGNRRRQGIGDLHERRAGRQQRESIGEKTKRNFEMLGDKGQPGYHRRRRLTQQGAEQPLEPVGIALQYRRLGIARAQQAAEGRIEFDQHHREGSIPRSTSAAVTVPVPGPSSMTCPGTLGSTNFAMARASGLPDGMTAPVTKGFAIHERIKRTSSLLPNAERNGISEIKPPTKKMTSTEATIQLRAAASVNWL